MLEQFHFASAKHDRKPKAGTFLKRGIAKLAREIEGTGNPDQVQHFHGRDIQGELNNQKIEQKRLDEKLKIYNRLAKIEEVLKI